MNVSEAESRDSSHRLDCLFDIAIDALEVLENCRARLHHSLREAHFSFSNTQREMDLMGLLLGWPAVPVAEGAVKPQLGVVRCVATSGIEGVAQCDNNDTPGWWAVDMRDTEGVEPVRWFAATPSAGLLECKRDFRTVFEACLRVVRAQEIALAAAAAYGKAVQDTT